MVLQHADYTVGWISSTPTDLTAAISMFDERHPDLPLAAEDPNSYILGRVAEHNVVITCFSHSPTGRSSSSAVATNLIRSFPAVKYSLLVGVGGGVPSSTVDIRLGDVVVSTPNGGVIQCSIPEGTSTFHNIGSLEPPPQALLVAANKLRTKRTTPRILTHHIEQAILRFPEVKEHATFPGREQDLLFQSNYDHEGDQCTNCSPGELIQRAPRNSTDPIIHGGSIASVDTVVKSTSLRDRLSQRFGVIGFDTEAAGLMQDFPCMMIRGIANYSDSHSNTSFQKYAAMTAAAYARELLVSLNAVSAQKILTEAEIHDLEILVDKSIVFVAQILASDERLNPLYNMALLRRGMNPLVFQRSLAAELDKLGGDMIKSTKSPVQRATAWILRRYKQAFATKIYELLQPPDVKPQQKPRSAFSKSKPSQELEEDKPDLAPLARLVHSRRFLFKGNYFDEFFKQLKKSLLPAPAELINRVLRQHIHHNSQSSSISGDINWQFLEYCDSEGITADDIESIFTLTGEFDRSCATTLGGYMEGKWKTGKSLLDGIKRSLTRYLRKDANEPEIEIIADDESHIEMQLFPKSADREERAFVKISGNFNRIAEILEQFAWLTATLRLYEEGQLTVSNIDFKAHQTNIGGRNETVFDISLYSQEKAFRPNTDAPGQCWTSVFTSSVLAHSFSLCGTDRPKDMLGLELPFDIMLRFTGVVCPVSYYQGLAFTSDSSILIPKVISGDSIQWHFQEIKTLTSRDTDTNIPDPQPEGLDIESLANARAFLGYSSNSEVLLGTADFADIEMTGSQVSRTQSFLEIKRERLLELGFNKYITGKVQVTCKWKRGERVVLEAKHLNLNERLDRATRASTLLYDDKTSTAYLLPELSVILQMVSIYVRKHARSESPEIPQAARSTDGGLAAKRAIENAQKLEVQLNIDSQKCIEIVVSYLDIFRQLKHQISVSRQEYGRISSKRGLRGWDFTDLQSNDMEFWERELSAAPLNSQPVWWGLFKAPACLVLFGRVAKSPISCWDTNAGQLRCRAWEEIPKGGHVLLASMIQLDRLKGELCQNSEKHPGRYMLTNTIAWSCPKDSRLFGNSCREGESCNPLQTMCEVGKLKDALHRLGREDKSLLLPRELVAEGTALFADDPTKFERRACQIEQV